MFCITRKYINIQLLNQKNKLWKERAHSHCFMWLFLYKDPWTKSIYMQCEAIIQKQSQVKPQTVYLLLRTHRKPLVSKQWAWENKIKHTSLSNIVQSFPAQFGKDNCNIKSTPCQSNIKLKLKVYVTGLFRKDKGTLHFELFYRCYERLRERY